MKTIKALKSIGLALLLASFSNLAIAQSTDVKQAEIQTTVTSFEDAPLQGEQIIFVGKNSGKRFKGVSDDQGHFTVKIDAGDTYDIKIKSIGAEEKYNTLKIPAIGPDEFFPPAQLSIKISPATTFTLNNVYFDVNKASLKPESRKELKDLLDYMKYKKGVSIEIGGHTDNVGTAEANKALSLRRANSIKSYLTGKGIAASRIKTVGYGEEQPVASNDTAEGRQKNRRTEVRILD